MTLSNPAATVNPPLKGIFAEKGMKDSLLPVQTSLPISIGHGHLVEIGEQAQGLIVKGRGSCACVITF